MQKDARIGTRKIPKQIGHIQQREVHGNRSADYTFGLLDDLGQFFVGKARLVHDAPATVIVETPGFGQFHTPCASIEQSQADVAL